MDSSDIMSNKMKGSHRLVQHPSPFRPDLAPLLEEARRDPGVTDPEHYTQYAIEPLAFIMANDLPFWVGNVIKYVLRADKKNGVEDLKKAKDYIEKRIRFLEEGKIR